MSIQKDSTKLQYDCDYLYISITHVEIESPRELIKLAFQRNQALLVSHKPTALLFHMTKIYD